MGKLISKSDFARLVNVSPAAINKQLKARLKNVTVGKRVDASHPDALMYIRERIKLGKCPDPGMDFWENTSILPSTNTPTPMPPVKPPAPPPPEQVEIPEDIEAVADLTIRQVVEKFGTVTAFSDWLKAMKSIADIKEKHLKNDISLGRVIDKEYVANFMFGAFETAFSQLVNDSPRTIAATLVESHEAGEPIEELQLITQKIISSQIKGVKDKLKKALKNAE